MHPNGHINLSEITDRIPWNAGYCACGTLKDARAKTCLACYRKRPDRKNCPVCKTTQPIENFYVRSNGQLIPRCKTCSCAKKPEDKRVRYKNNTQNRPGHWRKVSDYLTERRRTDELFRLKTGLSKSLGAALRTKGNGKSKRTVEMLGCSIADFKKHIERQWLPGMSWANWGRYRHCWQLDHIRPVSSFDLFDENDVKACFHFTNYQPLWAPDNARKRDKWEIPS